MAALAHLGVGLAAKRVSPKVPVYVLIICAWALDMLWGLLYFMGIESYPAAGKVIPTPWSHGLFMSAVWSLLAALITWIISRDKRMCIFIGLLVFSHWIIDFITHPMSAVYPDDAPLLLFFNGSPAVGLGLYGTMAGVNIGEYGTLLTGIIFYIIALRKLRSSKA